MPAYPIIEIDYSKCVVPFDCKKCLQACPQAVFQVHPLKVERLKETDKKEPGTFKLFAPFRDKCSMCNDCVEVCPVDALRISMPAGA